MRGLRISDVVGTDEDAGEVRLRIGDAVHSETFATGAAVYSAGFLVGNPAPPSGGEAAQCAWLLDGDDPTILGLRDNRWVSKLGTLKDGSWGMATDSEAVIKCVHDRDLIAIQSKGQGSGYTQQILNDGATDSIISRNGLSAVVVKPDSITLSVGNGSSITITQDAIRIIASNVYVTGGNVLLGEFPPGTAQPVAPIPAQGIAIGPQPGVFSAHVFAAL